MKLIPGRGPQLPADAAQALGLGKHDRILAWSALVGGGAAVATVGDLRVYTPRGQAIVRPWVEVDHAAWDAESHSMAVWWVGTRQTTPLELEDDQARLPAVIRERVQASVVLSSHVPLPGGKTARVALRRTADGVLSTQAIVPPGVRADAPDVAPLLARAADALRAEAGML